MERRRLTNGRGTRGHIAIEPTERRLLRRIWIDPERCGGRPCIRGHRLPVELVLELLASGISPEKICSDWYPSITPTDVLACLAFATHCVRHGDRWFLKEFPTAAGRH